MNDRKGEGYVVRYVVVVEALEEVVSGSLAFSDLCMRANVGLFQMM